MKKDKKDNQAGGTKFAEESAKGANAPSNAMLALFRAAPVAVSGIKMHRRNMPQMVKPDAVPVGGTVTAVIVDIVKSPVSTIKGMLLWLHLIIFSPDGKKMFKTGKEITFPCTGVIRNALAPGVDGEKDLLAALSKHKGKLLCATRTDDKLNTKFKKNMFMYDCFTSDDDVDLEKLELAAPVVAENSVDAAAEKE